MPNSCDLMVIAPHPDDSEFGVAGTVAKWVREGKTAVYVICTSGDKGSDDPDMTPERLAALREKEQRAAARVLGVQDVVFLGYEDQGLEDTSAFRRDLVRMIRTYRPHTVATCDPYRRYIWHRDHRVTGQVVLDALYPYARDRLAYPDLVDAGLFPHKVSEALLWGSEDPNHFVDITDTFEVKMEALRCHESQVGKRGPEFIEHIRQRHAALAQDKGFALAETFHRVTMPG